jgi:hypothetical protein
MFSQLDGPTALGLDLVSALSLSVGEVEIQTQDGPHRARCGVAGVWNGAKGGVVIVVRQLEPAAITRYEFADPIDSSPGLDHAVDAAIGFATSLGFLMDAPEFRELGEAERRERLHAWDVLRKHKTGRSRREARESGGPPSKPRTRAPDPDKRPKAQAAAPRRQAGGDSGRAVLGRIPLLRKDDRRLGPWARLLSFF